MKLKPFFIFALLALLIPVSAFAASLGKASDNFDNQRPDKSETAWGRLVADSLRASAKTDLALVSAGVLRKGTLKAGPVNAPDIAALFSFPDDEIVTMGVTGAQLRAALERAVQAYPTGSPAMLHLSGLTAAFNVQAPINRRLTLIRVGGKEVKDGDLFSVAMPISLASGGAGYYTIWNGRDTKSTGVSVSKATGDFVKSAGTVSPENSPRLMAQ